MAALKVAEDAAFQARKKAQLRYSFVQRDYADETPPPLAKMLRGGRGGQVRLKLYLSYLWLQRDDVAVPLEYPARAWAMLLDLRDPATAGARRITDAQAWLEEHKFVRIASRPGHPNQVVVLDDAGTGQEYVAPGAAARKEKSASGLVVSRYIQVPRTFWTNGHIAVLSGAAVAMFLALLCERGPLPDTEPLWFSPKQAEQRFALSEDTRTKGLHELVDAGLVRTSRRPVNPTDFAVRRMRNVHYLNMERLDEPAHIRPRVKARVLDMTHVAEELEETEA